MATLFLSHSHKDRQFAQRLAQDLVAKGVKVWFDEAEMKPGDSLISKIGEGIAAVDYLGVILSPASVTSRWVTQELAIALHSEIEEGKPRIVPIYYQKCDLPQFLRHRKYIDFTDGSRYRAGLLSLAHVILPESPYVYLTAREAARLVRQSSRPSGELFGLSQQGITQQYIDQLVMNERDWLIADAKTGRSVIWIVDFFDPSEKLVNSFGVFNGKVTPFPALHNRGDVPRIVDFNFIDSDVAVAEAIKHADAAGVIPDGEAYFINTKMRFTTMLDFTWSIFLMDSAFRNSFFTVFLSARSGSLVKMGATSEMMKKENTKMNLLKKIFRSSKESTGLYELKRRLGNAPRTIVEYDIIAREVMTAKMKKGLLDGVEKEVLDQLLVDWQGRIEDLTNRHILEELEQLGKLEEFELVLKHGLDQDAYFSYAISNYPSWIRKTLEDVKRLI